MNTVRLVCACLALSLHRLVHLAPHAHDREPSDKVAANGVPRTFVHNVMFVCLDALALVYHVTALDNEPVSRVDGALLALMLGGVALRYWCYSKLGPLFTYTILVKPDHRLVQDGPYALLLHPSYTGQIGVMCLYLVYMFRWKTVIWLPLIYYVLRKLKQRMRIEEQHLEEQLPAYASYKQNRWRLVPYLY